MTSPPLTVPLKVLLEDQQQIVGMEQHIAALGCSSKTAYEFLRNKANVLSVQQQLNWCDILQLPSDAIDWSTIYENNYYATNETILRSFQIRLNLRSNFTNVQLYVLNIASDNLCTFCGEEPETLILLFCDCKLLTLSGINQSINQSILFYFCPNQHT